jgi:nitric oxide synthase-interacting protein
MKAFWLPQLAPHAEMRVEAPTLDTLCPHGREKLRLKDLFAVTFTPDKHADTQPGAEDRFICPSCSSTFTNTSSMTAVSTCGHVLCSKCAQKFVAKEKACCVCAKPCKSKHLVQLEKGGTGFAGHGDDLVATAHKALGIGSGLADVRPATRVN